MHWFNHRKKVLKYPNTERIIEWFIDHIVELLIILGVIIAITLAITLPITGQPRFTENTTWKCKIQQGDQYKRVTTEGEVDTIGLSEWALLDLPICGYE